MENTQWCITNRCKRTDERAGHERKDSSQHLDQHSLKPVADLSQISAKDRTVLSRYHSNTVMSNQCRNKMVRQQKVLYLILIDHIELRSHRALLFLSREDGTNKTQ